MCRSDRCEANEQQPVGTNRDLLDARSCAEESQEHSFDVHLCA